MNYTKGEWEVAQVPSCFYVNSNKVENVASVKRMGDAHLIAAAPDMYLAGQGLDYAIGSAIIEIAKATTLTTDLLAIINGYILPAQENWRTALAKAEGKHAQ